MKIIDQTFVELRNAPEGSVVQAAGDSAFYFVPQSDSFIINIRTGEIVDISGDKEEMPLSLRKDCWNTKVRVFNAILTLK